MEKFAKVFEIDKYQVLFVLGSDGDKNPVLRFETRVDAGALTSSITFSAGDAQASWAQARESFNLIDLGYARAVLAKALGLLEQKH